MPTARKSPVTVLESTSPPGGGTPRELARSGRGALTFDPQPKAELAQGEYKGAREVLARHGRTAQQP
jgi:hypothetical protein